MKQGSDAALDDPYAQLPELYDLEHAGLTDHGILLDAMLPEKSDDRVTMGINQWAADSYPAVWSHLQKAKALDETIRKSTTN